MFPQLSEFIKKDNLVAIIFYNKDNILSKNNSIEIQKTYKENNITSFLLDSNEYIHTVINYYIQSLPCVLIFKDGKFCFKVENKDIKDIIKLKMNLI